MSEERRTFMKEIVVEVPEKDVDGKHARNTELTKEILDVQAEKSENSSDYNRQLKALRKEQKDLLETIASGRETIEVECYQDYDEERKDVLIRRCDNDDILTEFTRPMTAEELQMKFPEAAEDGEEPEEEETDDPGDAAA